MSAGVFTPELRFRWAKGQITTGTPDTGFVACGPGTPYPLEVTLAQVAEVYYRVRRATFVSGYIEEDQGAGVSNRIDAPTTEPLTAFYATDPASMSALRRFYGEQSAVVPTALDPYFGAEYDRGDGLMCRDLISERGMWVWSIVDTAFGWYSYDEGDSDTNLFTASETSGAGSFQLACQADCNIFKSVAVVRANPGDPILAPTNRFFLKLDFLAYNQFNLRIGSDIENIDPGGGATIISPCNYVLQLASSSASCQLYVGDYGFATYAASDFIHEATEWWPYAKNSPAVPVWDFETGAKL